MIPASNRRFHLAIERFDQLNSEDPNRIEIDGQSHPKELYHAKAMSRWIDTLYPDASEAVQLAARCQHLCRWEIPRSDYPEGKTAYLKWRNDLKKFHAAKSAEVLQSEGYDEETIDKVKAINLKKGLTNDPEVQAVEDALCLVFLETQFEDYLQQWGTDKTTGILQKTWSKMSPIAHDAALKLPFAEPTVSFLKTTLAATNP